MNSQLATYIIILCAGLTLAGCEEKNNTSTQAAMASEVEDITDNNVIKFSKSVSFPMVKAVSHMVSQELRVNGSIAPDIARTVAVNALSGGRIAEIHARLGDEVKKGQLLLKIHSPDLANAIANLKQARADQLLAERYYNRNKFLYDHGAVVAQKDLEASEDTLSDALATTENAVTQVKLLNADPSRPSPFVELRAPVSGVIVEQNITMGAAAKSLDATPNLFTIADLSQVWLLCDVYENYLSQVNLGDTAKIHVLAYPELQLQGKVVNIFSLLDPATRSTKVRIELDNSARLLRPGMFATAIFVSEAKVPRIAVPAAATYKMNDKDWMFFPQGPDKYRRSEVKVGDANPDGTLQIIAGLKDGDEVVANALQLSAAARAENPTAFAEPATGAVK
ncbi:MAG: efflux RND transporter periplasmic adaptor subunit [Methylomonas sp.]|jgi:cobalt-zinc-cadmium efflux system membrane fusion protein